MSKPHRKYSYIFGGSGLLLIIACVVIEIFSHPENFWAKSSLHVAVEIGIALISVSLIGILLETNEWSDYFTEKLKNIVIDKDFLETLDKSNVEKLYKNSAVRTFGEHIKEDNSLYDFLSSRTMTEIASPFREDLSLSLNIKIIDNKLEYIEELKYTCIAIKDKYHKQIEWGYFKDDIYDIDFSEVKIDNTLIDFADFTKTNDSEGTSYTYNLEQHKKEKLEVSIKVSYKGAIGRLWKIVANVPVRNITFLKVEHSKEIIFNLLDFGIDNSGLHVVEKRENYFEATYNNWLPINHGFALQLSKSL